MTSLRWRLVPFFIFIVLALLFWRGLALDPRNLPSTQIGKSLPYFKLKTLDGALFTPDSLKGSISLLNVWASWCMACADEQVTLMKLAGQGVAIYGLNYKDTIDNATQWLKEWGDPYKKIGEDVDGTVAINLGVYGAPETFLIDKEGIIRYRHVGPFTLAVWKTEFLPRIRSLEGVG